MGLPLWALCLETPMNSIRICLPGTSPVITIWTICFTMRSDSIRIFLAGTSPVLPGIWTKLFMAPLNSTRICVVGKMKHHFRNLVTNILEKCFLGALVNIKTIRRIGVFPVNNWKDVFSLVRVFLLVRVVVQRLNLNRHSLVFSFLGPTVNAYFMLMLLFLCYCSYFSNDVISEKSFHFL